MNETYFKTPTDLRRWLLKNHAKAPELLVGFYKTSTGKPSVTYPEALDQALCFGWIDGVRRSLGAESYTIRFTPRRQGSYWSQVNIKRAKELIELGQMQPAGLKAFEARDETKARRYSNENHPAEFPPAFAKQFRANKAAWDFFRAQAPSYQKAATWWVMGAKREETRLRRLATLIDASEKERRPGPLTPPGSAK